MKKHLQKCSSTRLAPPIDRHAKEKGGS